MRGKREAKKYKGKDVKDKMEEREAREGKKMIGEVRGGEGRNHADRKSEGKKRVNSVEGMCSRDG